VHRETTNLDAVLAGNILHERRLADNLDELFAGITILVEVTDISRRHLLFER
jgi:hypothetical protein